MTKAMIPRRQAWLRRNNLTVRKFAEAVGQDFGTAYKWFQSGRTPRRLYLDAVLAVFPDWPRL